MMAKTQKTCLTLIVATEADKEIRSGSGGGGEAKSFQFSGRFAGAISLVLTKHSGKERNDNLN